MLIVHIVTCNMYVCTSTVAYIIINESAAESSRNNIAD